MNFGRPVDPILALLLLGTADPESYLYCLRGGLCRTLLPIIWRKVAASYQGVIKAGSAQKQLLVRKNEGFPKFRGNISINMMPFVLGDEASIPPQYHQYLPLINVCAKEDSTELGKICYLTIEESIIGEKEATQRRPGLHCDSAGFLKSPSRMLSKQAANIWGRGSMGEQRVIGGIYLGSTVDDSCVIHDCRINPHVIGTHGSLEHLRKQIFEKCGVRKSCKAGQLYWITDKTPHESMVLQPGTKRQFFRLVTSSISHWYAEHSTSNDLCKVPENVVIIRGNKFLDQ